MPSTYAHYRMGQEVAGKLPEQIRKIVNRNKQLYDIGLHGPDILFYYHPLTLNRVNEIGYEMHKHSGKEFFEAAAEIIKKHPDDGQYQAYVYGFICHFALDVTCHGYIDDKIAESGISHTEIEVEFDRSLMIADGKNPITNRLTDHIIPSETNAEIIAPFFPGAQPQEVKKALSGMISCNNLLIAPSKLKRALVYAILRISGNYKEMHGLLVNYEENPACEDSTKMLYQLYAIAAERAVKMIIEFERYITDGQSPWNHIYGLTFGGQEGEQTDEI